MQKVSLVVVEVVVMVMVVEGAAVCSQRLLDALTFTPGKTNEVKTAGGE